MKNTKKPLKIGQAGGLACRAKYGPEFYSRIAKEAHKKRQKALKVLSK